MPMTGIGLILLGALILTVSLRPVYSLIALLPASNIKRYWQGLMLLIVMLIFGYLGFAVFFREHMLSNDLIVPAIFFFGSCFVWMTGTLFHRTAINLRRTSLLDDENITDPLLGIYNRRYLDRRLSAETARAMRYDLPLSVLMLDIDHFKKINDEYGHQAGDLVLGHVGKLILGGIRQSDIAARYEGEEIIIVTPDTAARTAGELAERLRNNIASHELVLPSESGPQQSVQVKVSIGVAGLDKQTTTLEQLIENAGSALDRARTAGRNRIRVYQSEAK